MHRFAVSCFVVSAESIPWYYLFPFLKRLATMVPLPKLQMVDKNHTKFEQGKTSEMGAQTSANVSLP